MLCCLHFIYRWAAGAPLLDSAAWTHPGGHRVPSSLAGAAQWAVLGGLAAPGSLISGPGPRLPAPNPSHCPSAETLKCDPMKKWGGLSREEVPGHFQLLEILQSCPQPDDGNQGWDMTTFWMRCTHTRQLLPTVPHWRSQGDCTVLTQTRGAQVLFTGLQSVGKWKPTKVPTRGKINICSGQLLWSAHILLSSPYSASQSDSW